MRRGGIEVEQQMAAESLPGYSGSSVATAAEPNLRAEFGAQLEANYPRLVAQLCMITLNAAEAQDVVQEAYARAWQRWSSIRELPNPTGWVRHMAIKASNRRWRRFLSKVGFGRFKSGASPSDDPQHQAVLNALGQIPLYRRRVLVLADVAQIPVVEIADMEGLDIGVTDARVSYAQRELNELLAQDPATVPPSANWEDM